MLSSVVLIPEEKIGIAVFTNKLPNAAYVALPHYLTEKLLAVTSHDWIQTYIELEKEGRHKADEVKKKRDDARAKDTHPSFDLGKYAGTYESDILGGATLSEERGVLHIQLEAHESLSGTLEHWHYDTFECHWDDPVLGESRMPFINDGQGNVTEFRVKIREDWIDPLEHVFKKA